MKDHAAEKPWREPEQHWTSERGHNEPESQEVMAAIGISARLWRLYAYFWLVCLVFPILSLIQAPPGGVHLFIAAAGLISYTAAYFWVMWPHLLNDRVRTRLGPRRSMALLVGLTLLVLLLSILYGSAFLWLFIGSSAIAGIILPFRKAAIAVIALTLLTLGVWVGISPSIASSNWIQIIPLVLLVRGLGLDMIGFVRLSDALHELHSAREDRARQAVTEERLRMARDLHDLLGHTLSLITLKSELARRLLENNDPGAIQEIQEVERVARQALREVREAVAGYRQQTLQSELDGARQILEAAGIVCTIEQEARALPPSVDKVLVWVVREGVTNVIRHSHAKHCRIQIISTEAYARAEISNDGEPQEKISAGQAGSGLQGLAERVRNLGGHMEAGPIAISDGTGFRLQVEIPIQNDRPVEAQ